MEYSFILLIILATYSGKAQNYNCFQSGAKNYFINNQGYVRGIRIDSIVASGGDSIYYPYRTRRISKYLEAFTPPNVDTLGGSWLGKNIIKQPDGTFLFDNLWDTVIIKTQAHTGDSWIFFDDTTNLFYTATVTSEGITTVLGSIDSIKTITITADSAGVVHTVDPVNNFQIILSKNHGFVQAFDLYTFPYHRPDTLNRDAFGYHYIRWIDYYLDVVLNNLGTCDVMLCIDNPPDTNNSIFHLFLFHNPTKMEIYDFNVGDVYESDLLMTGGTPPRNNNFYYLDTIRTRFLTTHNVSYTIAERQLSSILNVAGPSISYDTSYYYDPTLSSLADTSLLVQTRKMPEEWDGYYLLHFFPNSLPGSLTACDSPATYVLDRDYQGTFFSSNGFALFPSYASLAYSIGFGSSGFLSYDALTGILQSESLIFYKKGSITCGNFVYLPEPNRIVDPIAEHHITTTPNPAINYINITADRPFDSQTTLSVYDVAGRLLFHMHIDGKSEATINTTLWAPGVYLIDIRNTTGIIKKEKVIVLK